jgi:calcineurin-like phosphoesterase family protein
MALPGVYKIFNDRWAGQTVWCVSDTHFGDEDLRAGMPNRPSDEELVRRINAKVGRKDTLIVLGDVGDIEFAKKLRGYKVLICGNHDLGATRYKRHRDTVVLSVYDFTQEEAMEEMQRRYPGYQIKFECMGKAGWVFSIDNKLFDEVYEGALIVGEKLLLSHEPIEVPWACNFHGHDHKGAKRKGCYNFCADVISYEPVNLNQFLKSGIYKDVESVHRITINSATKRARKRGKKLGK